MADVVTEGTAGRRTRSLRAEEALKALSVEPDSPERLRRVLEQALVFAGATLAAVYTPSEDGELLCLVECAGVPRTVYGLRDGYSPTGRSPLAEARRMYEGLLAETPDDRILLAGPALLVAEGTTTL